MRWVHAESWNIAVREASGRERGMKISYLNFRLPLLRTGKKINYKLRLIMAANPRLQYPFILLFSHGDPASFVLNRPCFASGSLRYRSGLTTHRFLTYLLRSRVSSTAKNPPPPTHQYALFTGLTASTNTKIRHADTLTNWRYPTCSQPAASHPHRPPTRPSYL